MIASNISPYSKCLCLRDFEHRRRGQSVWNRFNPKWLTICANAQEILEESIKYCTEKKLSEGHIQYCCKVLFLEHSLQLK